MAREALVADSITTKGSADSAAALGTRASSWPFLYLVPVRWFFFRPFPPALWAAWIPKNMYGQREKMNFASKMVKETKLLGTQPAVEPTIARSDGRGFPLYLRSSFSGLQLLRPSSTSHWRCFVQRCFSTPLRFSFKSIVAIFTPARIAGMPASWRGLTSSERMEALDSSIQISRES